MSDLINEDSQSESDRDYNIKRSRFSRRQTVQQKKICAKEERNASIKKISLILQKSEPDRSFEESQMLMDCAETVDEIHLRWRKRDEAKRRLEEFEDSAEVLQQKCEILAQAIAQSQHLVIYTGAGISTAARIPDYRGTNGIWTRLQQGKDIGNHDLTLAEPTYTHMALSELYRQNIVKYVVSQNCDGLHLRSGLPKTALSELHGNMYVEVCKTCKPAREYLRLFDVTENTARYSHKTMRKCYVCNGPLVDSIVHFGERGSLQWPLNWSGACKNAKKATTIVCLGSSLKVLKKYPWLWQMDKPAKRRPNLYIVNLQWTPKDECATMKIHGKCDAVMGIVAKLLGIRVPVYERRADPIFVHATELCEMEFHTTSQPFLKLEHGHSSLLKQEQDCTKHELCNRDLTEADCDKNKSNIITEVKPAVHKENVGNLFSMERILDKTRDNHTTPTTNPLLYHPSYQAILAYYHQLSNTLLQPQIFGYSNLLYYPFETSLMYSGLHSIIKKETEKMDKNATALATYYEKPNCKFCYDRYKSAACLFYAKCEPQFAKKEFRFSKLECVSKPNVCICCDYTTDEDGASDTNDCADAKSVSAIECGEEEQKVKIQAGWFGKGCRKNKRLRKRQNSLPA